MDDMKGQITFVGMRHSRSLERMTARQVEKWIQRKQSLLFLPRWAEYSVRFDGESGEFVSCQVDIRLGSRDWTALEEGHSVQEALLKTIRHLRQKERLESERHDGRPLEQRAS